MLKSGKPFHIKSHWDLDKPIHYGKSENWLHDSNEKLNKFRVSHAIFSIKVSISVYLSHWNVTQVHKQNIKCFSLSVNSRNPLLNVCVMLTISMVHPVCWRCVNYDKHTFFEWFAWYVYIYGRFTCKIENIEMRALEMLIVFKCSILDFLKTMNQSDVKHWCDSKVKDAKVFCGVIHRSVWSEDLTAQWTNIRNALNRNFCENTNISSKK